MSDTSIIAFLGLIVLIALVVGAWRLFRMWNSPDGERYNRMNLNAFFESRDKQSVSGENRGSADHDRS
jgi:hypothetical protein